MITTRPQGRLSQELRRYLHCSIIWDLFQHHAKVVRPQAEICRMHKRSGLGIMLVEEAFTRRIR